MLHAADHGREVAREGRESVVALEQLDDVATLLAAMHQLDAGKREAFREDIGGIQREAAGILAAGIALVRLQGLDQNQFARIVEHRRIDIIVLQMAAAIIRVVADEHVARAPVIVFEIHRP